MKGCDATKLLVPCCSTVLILPNFFDLSSTAFEFSLFVCSNAESGRFSFVVTQNWIILPQTGNLLEELKSRTESSFFSYKLTCLSAQFSASVQTPRCLVCSSVHLCLSSSVAQFPWFHCALWSAFGFPRILSLSHSASLYLLHLSLFYPIHNTRRRSLSMLVLSHAGTHYLNRHMAWCGCHDILIERFILVLFLSDFSLYPI